MPSQSRRFDHSISPPNHILDSRQLQSRLPTVLSAVAGMVDVISFVSFKLFTAHVTGNLVVIAALLVRGGPPNLAQILAVPVFILAVSGVWLIAQRINKRGSALARPLLLIQFLLLACVLVVAVVFHPAADPHGLVAGVVAMIAVSAMACQFALLRLAVPGAPSTAVMTGNLTKTTLSLLDTLSGNATVIEGARMQLKKTLQLVAGFFVGCLAGAAAVSWMGEWAWSLPVVLAGVAAGLPSNRL
ncbi:MAG TPA: YoaK family protein [Candidatus Angelobacter sp.]|nr:YoaK family protein [Candidatus Angelobacter sp.]